MSIAENLLDSSPLGPRLFYFSGMDRYSDFLVYTVSHFITAKFDSDIGLHCANHYMYNIINENKYVHCYSLPGNSHNSFAGSSARYC